MLTPYKIRIVWPDGTEKIFPSQMAAATELKLQPNMIGKYATRANHTIATGVRRGIKIERIEE